MVEIPLAGGRVTAGVVRVGATVRRPGTDRSAFVRSLLGLLRQRGFEAAPRYLGCDEQGREVFSFLEGEAPAELDPAIPDEALVAAARQIRCYHDATAGSELAGAAEVVCHNDLSPCNFVFRDRVPVGIIDFDAAAPGTRLQDVGYALFLWLNLGTDGAPLGEQARRIGVFCAAYGIDADERVVSAILTAVATNLERLRRKGVEAAEWWEAQLNWLAERRGELDARLAGER